MDPMEVIQEEKKITWTEHNKVINQHTKQWKEDLALLEKNNKELYDLLDHKQKEYELNTPLRLRRLNSEYQIKIYDLEDTIADKEDIIDQLRDKIKELNQSIKESIDNNKLLSSQIESNEEKIEELREQIKKKSALIKKYSNKK